MCRRTLAVLEAARGEALSTVARRLRQLGYTWKRSRYLVVHPDEPGAKEDAPDGKAVALLAVLVD